MKNFRYLQPETVEEAIELLRAHSDEAKLMAGGQSLLILMREGLLQPAVVIGLSKIPGLAAIRVDDASGAVSIGALTTHRQVELSPAVHERFPLLAEAYRNLGSVQVRNVGTMGGNLCHNAPGSDPPVALAALGAVVRIRGAKTRGRGGERVVPVEEFGTSYYETSLGENEMLVSVEIPAMPPGAAGAYQKYAMRKSDLPFVGAAAVLTPDGDGKTCLDARIVLGGVAPTAIRAVEAEDALRGRKLTEDLVSGAAELAANGVDPLSDTTASAEYRRGLVPVAVRRVVMTAWQRAQEA